MHVTTSSSHLLDVIVKVVVVVLLSSSSSVNAASTVVVDIVKNTNPNQEIQIRGLNEKDGFCASPYSKVFSRGPYSPEVKSVTCNNKSSRCQLRLLRLTDVGMGEVDWRTFNKIWVAHPLNVNDFNGTPCSPTWYFKTSQRYTIDFRMDVYDAPVVYAGDACSSIGVGCSTASSSFNATTVDVVMTPIYLDESVDDEKDESVAVDANNDEYGSNVGGDSGDRTRRRRYLKGSNSGTDSRPVVLQ